MAFSRKSLGGNMEMIGAIISCIGILSLLILMTIMGFCIDWKIGLSNVFITMIIVGVFLTIFV